MTCERIFKSFFLRWWNCRKIQFWISCWFLCGRQQQVSLSLAIKYWLISSSYRKTQLYKNSSDHWLLVKTDVRNIECSNIENGSNMAVKLTPFFLMFPFDPLENIRGMLLLVICPFFWRSKGNIGKKRVNEDMIK